MKVVDSWFAQYPWQLSGQTVERRLNPTFRHADFPDQTIMWQGEGDVVDT
jgi:hypothetical protein